MAVHNTQTKSSTPLATDVQTQQGFIDERAPINPTDADSSRNANEGEDEDERDDEMSEPTQLTRTEKRKEIQTDDTAKELRALFPVADSSFASSLRPSDETKEQLEPSSKQVRTAKNGVETLQDVSCLFQKGHREHQRNGFLQMSMAGMRKKNNKRVLKKKDGERNLHFPSCTPDVQAATRRTEWNQWMKFNAGVLLTDEEVRPLTEAGCEIYPMKWFDTDKNAYLRRDGIMFLFPKYKSRLVGCGNFETTEGLRTDSPAGDVDSHNIVCSWCAQAHVLIHSCDFTNGYFRGQEIDRILMYRIPAEGVSQKKELQAEKFWPHVFPSTVHKMQDEDYGFD